MWFETWDPLVVVLAAFFLESLVGVLVGALVRRRGKAVDHHDPAFVAFKLFLKGGFVLMTLAILEVVLVSAKALPDLPPEQRPEQLASWMRDEQAAVLQLRGCLVAVLLYLGLQLFMAFSLSARLGLGRPRMAAGAPQP